MTVKPSLTALWLADVVLRDDDERPTASRIFNRITISPDGGEYARPFTVFFSAAEVRVSRTCFLQLVDLSDLHVVYERQVILDPIGPDEILDMTVRVNRLPELHPGAYTWELHHGDERLTCTRMVVVEGD